jgi:hypothetical protein
MILLFVFSGVYYVSIIMMPEKYYDCVSNIVHNTEQISESIGSVFLMVVVILVGYFPVRSCWESDS